MGRLQKRQHYPPRCDYDCTVGFPPLVFEKSFACAFDGLRSTYIPQVSCEHWNNLHVFSFFECSLDIVERLFGAPSVRRPAATTVIVNLS